MNLVSAICPSCGAQIQIPPDQDRAFCSYCGNQIMAEAAIAYGKVKIDGVVKTQSADFVIEAGVLKEYHGTSTDVVVPDNVTAIEGAFNETLVTTVTLPEGLKAISMSFFDCASLKTIELPKSLESLTGAFNYSALEHITLPGNVSELGYRNLNNGLCFSGCKFLEEVVIEEGVTRIGEGCFSNCPSLRELTVPTSVTEIGPHAFSECKNLESVNILGSEVRIDSLAFRNCPLLARVTASKSVLEAAQQNYSFTPSKGGFATDLPSTPWRKDMVIQKRKEKGECAYCGGMFKGLLTKKCSRCGKPKSY